MLAKTLEIIPSTGHEITHTIVTMSHCLRNQQGDVLGECYKSEDRKSCKGRTNSGSEGLPSDYSKLEYTWPATLLVPR